MRRRRKVVIRAYLETVGPTVPCIGCNGEGWLFRTVPCDLYQPGGTVQVVARCRSCGGRGRVAEPDPSKDGRFLAAGK
jgi:hypothetical protein